MIADTNSQIKIEPLMFHLTF